MYTIGYDIGSSSIKAALVNVATGETVKVVQYPHEEMPIHAERAGWAEQDPEMWWDCILGATKNLMANVPIGTEVSGIGIAYQMHGLVAIDAQKKPVRPSIIWCDSRAVTIGENAFNTLGRNQCLHHLLNSPGNFTASKIRWVLENELDLSERIAHIMLPGDYISMKMTGDINTTVSGLSEGILWDFQEEKPAQFLLDHYGISKAVIPPYKNSVEDHGHLTKEAAQQLGLKEGIVVGYKAGDQPNNAMSLGVLQPGQVAATGGTSGVVYGVTDMLTTDQQTRVNSFAHVNHSSEEPRVGVLLCINGAGIQYSWLRRMIGDEKLPYNDLEDLATQVEIGADGLRVIPFGNGAERLLANQETGSHWINLQFNRHQKRHLIRASLEGIAFSFIYGMHVMQDLGIDVSLLKVGNDNLFQSAIFSTTIATLMQCKIEMVETTGAVGAAKAAAVTLGVFSSLEEAFSEQKILKTYVPDKQESSYRKAYHLWKENLMKMINV